MNKTFPWPIIIALMLGHTIVSAQTVMIEGIVREELPVKEGKIVIYLPDDIRAGDVITGTVEAEPGGNTEKEKIRNSEALQKYKIRVGDIILPTLTSPRLQVKFAQGKSGNYISILDDKNNVVQNLMVNTGNRDLSRPKQIQTPSHVLLNSNLPIRGPFDGDATNTRLMIDGKPVDILAESPRQIICEIPQTTSGPHIMTIEENGVTTQKQFSAVDMALSAMKTNLRKGEKTTVTVNISGLQGIQENATLAVTNTSPSTIVLSGGNTQVITISPSQVNNGAVFTQNFEAQSLTTGNFTVSADLDLPDPPEESKVAKSNWKLCDLDITKAILPGSVCDQLQKGMTTKLNQQPLLVTKDPIVLPATGFHLEHKFEKDHLFASLGSPTSAKPTEQVIFSYEKITADYKNEKLKNNPTEWVIDPENDGKISLTPKVPLYRFEPGLYHMRATVYYGDNQSYIHNSYVVVPQKRNNPNVRNSTIDKLIAEEKRLRDSIYAANYRIRSNTDDLNKKENEKRRLDSIANSHATQYNQLHRIDALIEQIPGLYGADLQALVDSLESLKKRAGTLDPQKLDAAVDQLEQNVAELEAALKACQQNLADLEKEQEDLKNEKDQIQKDQEKAYRDILAACKEQGYGFAGEGYHSSSTGQFTYNFGLILGGKLIRGIPGGAVSKISALQNKIKEGNNRIAAINARQAELPGEIENAKKECEDLAARLAKAKLALQSGAGNVAAYNQNMAALDEICSQVKKLLASLANWCKKHPGQCNSFEYQLKKMMEDCPANLDALPNLMNQLGQVINQKKQVEEQHKDQAEENDKKAEDLGKVIDGIADGIQENSEKAESAGSALDQNMQDQDRAIDAEIAKRQADEAAKKAAKKRVCIEFLKSQASSPEEANMIEDIAAIKDQIQGMAENVKTAANLGDRLTKDKLKELTDKLRGSIDKLMEKFEKFEELKGKLDQLLTLKDDLETLTSDEPSAKAAAAKMGVVLRRINDVLQEVSEKFPLLYLFTAYFGIMVEAFNAIISGAYSILGSHIGTAMQQVLEKNLTCENLVAEYSKRNSLDDAMALADKICRADGQFMLAHVNNGEKRRVYEEELKKYVLKLMMDCCMRWALL